MRTTINITKEQYQLLSSLFSEKNAISKGVTVLIDKTEVPYSYNYTKEFETIRQNLSSNTISYNRIEKELIIKFLHKLETDCVIKTIDKADAQIDKLLNEVCNLVHYIETYKPTRKTLTGLSTLPGFKAALT